MRAWRRRNCCDPGFNTTGLGRDLPFAGLLDKLLHALRTGDPRRGARIIVRLATDPAFAETTGGEFSVKDAAPLTCPEPGRSKGIQADLWETTASLLEGSSSPLTEAPPAGNGSTLGGTRIRPGWRLLQQRW
jgi:hypothetical protein